MSPHLVKFDSGIHMFWGVFTA